LNAAAMPLIALRGAATVGANEADAILDATEELMVEVLGRNELRPEDLISCIFTLTPDLDAEFPAVAARRMGLSGVPLLCAQEIPVPGALPSVIRVLVHCNLKEGREPRHVYLGEARCLRLDLHGAQ
jgi:chorismate mutase